ncbi:MAG: host attachment protein [Chlamydiia bacterium]|nr:host attachment protein [Chlamydiia bacterium]
MRKVLVVVANSSKARFFENLDNSHLSELAPAKVHVESCMKGSELMTDRVGNYHKVQGKRGLHATERPRTPQQNESCHFAHELADAIEDQLNECDYERLYIIASKPFLGRLRQKLGKRANKTPGEEIGSDLTSSNCQKIRDHLPYTL